VYIEFSVDHIQHSQIGVKLHIKVGRAVDVRHDYDLDFVSHDLLDNQRFQWTVKDGTGGEITESVVAVGTSGYVTRRDSDVTRRRGGSVTRISDGVTRRGRGVTKNGSGLTGKGRIIAAAGHRRRQHARDRRRPCFRQRCNTSQDIMYRSNIYLPS